MTVYETHRDQVDDFLSFVFNLYGAAPAATCRKILSETQTATSPKCEDGAVDLDAVFGQAVRTAVPSLLELAEEMASMPYSSR
jgi:hypothetical protein